MKKIHLERGSDLLRALIVIQEDVSSEKEKQEKMTRRLSGNRVDEKEDEEEPAEEPEEDADAGEEDSADAAEEEPTADDKKSKPDDGKLPGAKRLEDAELKTGQKPTMKDIAQRINFIRAGASLKDEDVKRDIAMWITQLKEPERLAVYTTLDALAKIVLGRKSAAEVPTLSGTADIEIKGAEQQASLPSPTSTKQTKVQHTKPISAGPVPIVVGEGAVRKLKEIDVPVRSGKVVPFGSKSHTSDIEGRIDDLKRIRSYQERGSDTHHALGLAIVALKKQLAAAYKRGALAGNPRTQPVPPIVEKK